MRTIENLLEGLIYASRWLLAPIYMILCLCLALIAITTIQHFIQYAPGLMSMKLKEEKELRNMKAGKAMENDIDNC